MPTKRVTALLDASSSLAAPAALALALAALVRNRAFFHDDAFITLRYARNLIAGQGPVWNAGERVEGYTNFLHLMLTSGLAFPGLDLLTAARCVSALSWIGLVALLLAAGRRIEPGGAGRIPAIVAATSFPILIWILGGLETPLFAFLLTLTCWLGLLASDEPRTVRPAIGAGACGALAAMTRPEGLIAVVVVGCALLLNARRARNARAPLAFAIAFLAIFGPFLAWRYGYYGDPLPNTFYVKGTGGGTGRLKNGIGYAARFFLSPPFVLPLALGGFLVARLAGVRRLLDRRALVPAFTVLLFTAYVVSVGGDHMPAFRFLAPIVPLLGILLLFAARALRESGREGMAAALPGLIVLLGVFQFVPHALNPVKADPAAWKGGVVGRYVAREWPAGALVALNTAGTTPYFAPDLRFLDMLGLNDRTIAHRVLPPVRTEWQLVPGHAKGDGAYVLGRKPDFIIIGPAEGTTLENPWFLSDAEIAERASEMARDYRLESVEIDVTGEPGHEDYQASAGGTMVFTYYRRTGETGR